MFVKTLLAPHLYGAGFLRVDARLVGNARARSRRGGIRDRHVVRRDIERHLKQDSKVYASLMVDYYALPLTWPGRNSNASVSIENKHEAVCAAILADFESYSGISGRFVPFVLMHEFEAMLFADCQRFASALGYDDKHQALQDVRDAFATSEHINDSPQTAPSKRVAQIIPRYDKVLYGNVAATEIGLASIRSDCRLFDRWVQTLETLPLQ
jgi:hypothetical protein